MTQQNMHKENEAAHAVRDRNNSELKASDSQVAGEPIEETHGFFDKYCDSNPAASQCRVYDL